MPLSFQDLEDALKVLQDADIVAKSGHFGTNVVDVANVVGNVLNVLNTVVTALHETHPDNPANLAHDEKGKENGG